VAPNGTKGAEGRSEKEGLSTQKLRVKPNSTIHRQNGKKVVLLLGKLIFRGRGVQYGGETKICRKPKSKRGGAKNRPGEKGDGKRGDDLQTQGSPSGSKSQSRNVFYVTWSLAKRQCPRTTEQMDRWVLKGTQRLKPRFYIERVGSQWHKDVV